MTPILDRAAFIRAETRLLPVPLVPEIRLHLAHEATDLWQRTEDELGGIGLPPPFWAFAWAGGQALARFCLDRAELLAGRRVLDVASGSGLVAIAAARCGAASVEAAEIDDFAAEAIPLNAAANGVALRVRHEDLVGRDEGWDAVLAGDIFYDRDIAGRMEAWLHALARRGATVLIGDPGRSYLPVARLAEMASYCVPVTRSLEDAEIKLTRVWRFADQDPEPGSALARNLPNGD
ncbi:methyltransferase [Enterovirga sp.]|uniref:class I SAM-dependent methyltransferase n=1 Tax=Enterovirga sp. TaxID=2026350 RepID=UPI002611C739|nr:methyltransferase [Enterovirga sp.]MDB5590849.1 nicotinamide N-methylase [Enterovirga sp.]